MSFSRSPLVIVALALGAVGAPRLHAQEVGDRVRVSVLGAATIGEVVAVNGEAFELAHGGMRSTFHYRLVHRLERSVGSKRLWKEGFVSGAAGGVRFATGLVTGCFDVLASVGGTDNAAAGVVVAIGCTIASAAAIVIVVPAAALGAISGASAGVFTHGDVWTPVPLDGRTAGFSPVVAPRFGPEGRVGLELGTRIRFW